MVCNLSSCEKKVNISKLIVYVNCRKKRSNTWKTTSTANATASVAFGKFNVAGSFKGQSGGGGRVESSQRIGSGSPA